MKHPDLPVRVSSSSRQIHLDDHNNDLRNSTLLAINSLNYANLQDALDDAVESSRPLVIAPKSYTLNTGLLMNHLNDVHVFAYGATFVANADMPALLDHRDCVRCSWHGGRFNVATGRVVPNSIYVYRNAVQSTRNTFRDIVLEGDYSVGLRVGKQGSGLQCDHMWFTNMEFIGLSLPGQIGVYVGDGVFANCLNHTFDNLMCSGHETHVKVDATNAHFTNFFGDSAATDFLVTSSMFTVDGGRCENSRRMLVTGGPANYVANIAIRNMEWRGSDIATDGEWIQHHLANTLRLTDVQALNAIHPPIVRVSNAPGVPCRVAIDGLSTEAAAVDAFVLSSGAFVEGYYTQHNTDGSVASITKL